MKACCERKTYAKNRKFCCGERTQTIKLIETCKVQNLWRAVRSRLLNLIWYVYCELNEIGKEKISCRSYFWILRG